MADHAGCLVAALGLLAGTVVTVAVPETEEAPKEAQARVELGGGGGGGGGKTCPSPAVVLPCERNVPSQLPATEDIRMRNVICAQHSILRAQQYTARGCLLITVNTHGGGTI